MEDSNTIVIEIAAEVEKLKSAFKKVEDAAADSGAKIDKSLSLDGSLNKGLTSLKRELLAVGAAVVSAFAFKKMISEAMGAEEAVNDLNGALRAAGQPVASASARFQEYAAGLQSVTTVSDDAIISSAAVLVSIGKLSGEGLERATKAALDLSAGLNISLDSAMERIARAANGNTMAFDKMGFNISKTGSDATKFAEVMGQLEQRFGGSAENKVNTFGGALSQLSNRFNDVLETLGKMATQSPVVIALLKALGDVFLAMNNSITGLAGSGDVVGDLIKTFLGFGQTIVTYVVAPLEMLYNVGVITFNTLKVAGQSLLVLFLDIGNVIVQTLVYPMQKVSEGAAVLASVVSDKTAKAFKDAAEGFKSFRDGSTMAAEGAREVLTEFDKELAASNDKLFDFNVSEKISTVVAKVKAVADAAKEAAKPTDDGGGNTSPVRIGLLSISDAFGAMSDGIDNRLADLKENAVKNFKDIGAAAFNTMGAGVGNAFAAMGKAIASGQNGLKAFAGAMLAALGQAAIQIGQMFIMQGLAYTLTGNAAQGVPLMAAGAALAALGGVMSAVSGGGGGATASAASGGGMAGSSSEMVGKPAEREQKETGVQVIVQGNVLDRRETGLAIVETLNEFFNTSDGRITRSSLA